MRGEKEDKGREEGPVDSIHHTLNKYLLSNFYMANTVLGILDIL